MKFYKAKGLKFEKVELNYELIKSLYVSDESKLEEEEKVMNRTIKNIIDTIEEKIKDGNEATKELVQEVIITICNEKEEKYKKLQEEIENLEIELLELRTLNPNNKGLHIRVCK